MLLFLGDVAISQEDYFKMEGFPPQFFNNEVFLNLEGAICLSNECKKYVTNNINWAKNFSQFKNIAGVCLANNHITDFKNSLKSTINLLQAANLPFVGAGASLENAKKTLKLKIQDEDVIIIAAGWQMNSCIKASSKHYGVNIIDENELIKQVIESNPNQNKVIINFHWNYEFEKYPQPAHRKLAKLLIDNGAYAIIGHHPHIVSPIEIYKNKPIIYSLGNWMFSYKKHINDQLTFPDESFYQIALQLDFKNHNHQLYHAHFKPPETISFLACNSIFEKENKLMAEFEGFKDKQYEIWFKKYRKKKKFLPIFYTNDNSISNLLKARFVLLRQNFIKLIVKLKLKKIKPSL